MPFINPAELAGVELFPKITSGLVAGEHLMLSFLDMEVGCEVPEHSHPHEQAGLVMEGRLRFRIGTEETVLESGHAFVVPSNTAHSGVVESGPARVLDVFSPPREDYLAKQSDAPPA